MSDRVYRVKWIDPVEMDRFESWLEHMAGKGLFFERAGFWCYTFRRGAPAEARYRLETAGRLGDGERLEYCRALGWELQGPVGERFDLFRCDDPSAPELNTDPVVQGEGLARVAEQVKWHCVLLAALTLLLLAVVLLPFSLPSWPCPVLSLVRGPLWGRFAPFFMNLLTLGWTFRACGAFFRLRRRLRKGEAPRRTDSWRAARRAWWVHTAVLVGVFALYLGVTVCTFALSRHGTPAELDRPVPLLPLAEAEGDADLEVTAEARYDWSPFAPEQYWVEQQAAGGDGARLSCSWYRLSLPRLASPLLDDLMEQHRRFCHGDGSVTFEPLSLPGFDQAAVERDCAAGEQQLFLQKGSVVIALSYSGRQDLTRQPELLEELAEFGGG